MVTSNSLDGADAPHQRNSSDSSCSSLSSFNEGVSLKSNGVVYIRDLEDGLLEGADDDHYYYETDSLTTTEKRRGRRSTWRRLLMALRRRVSGQPKGLESQSILLLDKATVARPQKPRKFSLCTRLCTGLPVLVLCMLGVVQILDTILGLGSSIWDRERDDFLPDWGQPGRLGEGLANYPTDFTRDVIPIPCHSHNDYWRRVPLYQALHYGCTGVEADVWLFAEQENDLFVGHNTAALTPNRTFLSLYVNPLVEILDHQNPHTRFANVSHHGVFDEDPEQTLVLLIDFKTDGPSLFPIVQEQLEPLRSKGYLTYYDGNQGKTIQGPITVVATGNAPFDLLVANTTYRDIFFDAPLASMWSSSSESELASSSYIPNRHIPSSLVNRGQGQTGTDDTTATSFDATNSFYASANFGETIGHIWGGRLSRQQVHLLKGQIRGAKKQGLKPRYWGTPSWPIGLRNQVWDILIREGVSYLNVDDLHSAARKDWGRHRRGHAW